MDGRQVFLVGALISIILAFGLFLRGNRNEGIFVGLWAPTLLQLGHILTETED